MRSKFIIATRIFFGLLTLTAMGVQLIRHVNHSFSVINFFSYFTNLSNLFIAIVLLVGVILMLCGKRESKTFTLIRGAATLGMIIVGIVFTLLLRHEDLGILFPWVNTVLHYVMPIAALADWLLAPPKIKLQYNQLWYWLIFPLIYVTYSLIRGAHTHWYAYPFFNPAKHGYVGVGLYCIAICIVFILLGSMLIRLSHIQNSRSKHA